MVDLIEKFNKEKALIIVHFFIHSLVVLDFPQRMTLGLSYWDFPGGSEVKASACNAGDLGSISGLGRSPGEGNCNLFPYSCLGNPMDRRAWQTTVCGVTKELAMT